MHKYFYVFILAFCNISCNYAQKELIPYRKGDLWGFSDKSKKIIIACQYEDAEPFKYGLAKVQLKQKYGLIHPTGKLILATDYDNIIINSELIVVRKNGLKGVFDINGKEIVPIKYQEIEIDEENNIFATAKYKNITFFDKKGAPISSKELKKQTLSIVLDSKTNKYGLNKENKPITPYKYDEIGELSEGFLAFKIQDKWGFIDITGKEVILPKYDDVSPFEINMARVCMNGKCGIINKEGKEVIPCQYQNIKMINLQTFAVQTNEGKWGIVDDKKKVIQVAKYDDVSPKNNNYLEIFLEKDVSFLKKYDYASDFKNGITVVTLKRKKGFVTEEGKEITPIIYEDAQDFQEGRALLRQNGKWGFINKNGNLIVPYKYEEGMSFSEGMAAVKSKGKWGFIDITGKEIITCKYDIVGAFTNGITLVISNGKTFIINKEGKIQIDISENDNFETETTLEIPDPPNLFTPQKLRKKLGYVDSKGTEYWED